ncbi:hypothetical protein D3C73_834570 [compost metagenome]
MLAVVAQIADKIVLEDHHPGMLSQCQQATPPGFTHAATGRVMEIGYGVNQLRPVFFQQGGQLVNQHAVPIAGNGDDIDAVQAQ